MALLINVGAEDFDVATERAVAFGHALTQKDGNGIDFLTGRAAGHPNADRLAGCLGRDQCRKRGALESFERIGIAEELGHANEQLMEQGLELTAIRLEALDVAGDIVNMQHLHAALDAPDQGVLLVSAEIVVDARAEEPRNRRQVRSRVRAGSIAVLAFCDHAQVLLIVDEQARHVLDRHDMIDHAGVGRTLRHASLSDMVELGLSQSQPAVLLDHAHAVRAITADPGQDDGDGSIAAVFGKRGKKRVDGTALLAWRSRGSPV